MEWVADLRTRLEWSRETPEENTWHESMAIAEDLGIRLPTRAELVALYDSLSESSKKNHTECIWSSTTYDRDPNHAWYFCFASGRLGGSFKYHFNHTLYINTKKQFRLIG